MIRDDDRQWLAVEFPGLVAESDAITGHLEITATFNPTTGLFLQISEGTIDGVGGVLQTGRFAIRIEPRLDTTNSRLPALFVEGVDRSMDRHFNQTDGSGCICNPLEEGPFLHPEFDFRRYMKELVVPFLYGQGFFTKEKRWPWSEYAHGVLGLIEACTSDTEPAVLEECLRRLPRESSIWGKAKALLQQKSYIKGHSRCPCPKNDHLRRCHPRVLTGLRVLQEYVVSKRITLP
jgi:hypothetical protein